MKIEKTNVLQMNDAPRKKGICSFITTTDEILITCNYLYFTNN